MSMGNRNNEETIPTHGSEKERLQYLGKAFSLSAERLGPTEYALYFHDQITKGGHFLMTTGLQNVTTDGTELEGNGTEGNPLTINLYQLIQNILNDDNLTQQLKDAVSQLASEVFFEDKDFFGEGSVEDWLKNLKDEIAENVDKHLINVTSGMFDLGNGMKKHLVFKMKNTEDIYVEADSLINEIHLKSLVQGSPLGTIRFLDQDGEELTNYNFRTLIEDIVGTIPGLGKSMTSINPNVSNGTWTSTEAFDDGTTVTGDYTVWRNDIITFLNTAIGAVSDTNDYIQEVSLDVNWNLNFKYNDSSSLINFAVPLNSIKTYIDNAINNIPSSTNDYIDTITYNGTTWQLTSTYDGTSNLSPITTNLVSIKNYIDNKVGSIEADTNTYVNSVTYNENDFTLTFSFTGTNPPAPIVVDLSSIQTYIDSNEKYAVDIIQDTGIEPNSVYFEVTRTDTQQHTVIHTFSENGNDAITLNFKVSASGDKYNELVSNLDGTDKGIFVNINIGSVSGLEPTYNFMKSNDKSANYILNKQAISDTWTPLLSGTSITDAYGTIDNATNGTKADYIGFYINTVEGLNKLTTTGIYLTFKKSYSSVYAVNNFIVFPQFFFTTSMRNALGLTTKSYSNTHFTLNEDTTRNHKNTSLFYQLHYETTFDPSWARDDITIFENFNEEIVTSQTNAGDHFEYSGINLDNLGTNFLYNDGTKSPITGIDFNNKDKFLVSKTLDVPEVADTKIVPRFFARLSSDRRFDVDILQPNNNITFQYYINISNIDYVMSELDAGRISITLKHTLYSTSKTDFNVPSFTDFKEIDPSTLGITINQPNVITTSTQLNNLINSINTLNFEITTTTSPVNTTLLLAMVHVDIDNLDTRIGEAVNCNDYIYPRIGSFKLYEYRNDSGTELPGFNTVNSNIVRIENVYNYYNSIPEMLPTHYNYEYNDGSTIKVLEKTERIDLMQNGVLTRVLSGDVDNSYGKLNEDISSTNKKFGFFFNIDNEPNDFKKLNLGKDINVILNLSVDIGSASPDDTPFTLLSKGYIGNTLEDATTPIPLDYYYTFDERDYRYTLNYQISIPLSSLGVNPVIKIDNNIYSTGYFTIWNEDVSFINVSKFAKGV